MMTSLICIMLTQPLQPPMCRFLLEELNWTSTCFVLASGLMTNTVMLLSSCKEHYPCVGGLQDPIMQVTQSFEVECGEFVQILNVNETHRITISKIECPSGHVKLYNSTQHVYHHLQSKQQVNYFTQHPSRCQLNTLIHNVRKALPSVDHLPLVQLQLWSMDTTIHTRST